MKRLTTLALVVSTLPAGGCALVQHVGDMIRGPVATSQSLVHDGKPAEAIEVLKKARQGDPRDIAVDAALANTRTAYVNDEIHMANVALAAGNDDQALAHLQNALESDPRNLKAEQLVARIQRRAKLREMLKQAVRMRDAQPDEALARVNGVLAEQPDFAEALKLREQLEGRLENDGLLRPRLSETLRKPVSLNFRSQPLQNIFDVISRMSGVNFVFDKDVQTAAPASIFAAKTTAEDAINLLLRTNQLAKRVLDARTLLIYPARPDKDRNYKEFAIRTFFLSQADARNVMAALRQMIKPREVYVDERTNSVIVRDTPAMLEVADRLVRGLDIPQSEVTMDVQVLEVNTNDEVNLGVDYPGKVTASAGDGDGHVFTIGDLLHFHGSSVALQGDAGALKMAINMLQKQGKTKTLANPKIRVRNLEKASINIGEQVPIVTTTNSTGVVSESVSYQNVGLTLKVEPRIALNDEVGVKVDLEVSDILSTQTTKTGLIAYTLGTRKAQTLMTARDDETQVLAGLIKRNQSETTSGIPYLSRIPGLNRLFGTHDQTDDSTEIVLLITPHIERNLSLPAASASTFLSGTEAEVTSEPMTLGEPADSGSGAPEDGAAMTDAIAPAEPAGASDGAATHAGDGPAQADGSGTSATHAGGGSPQAGASDASATHAGDDPAQAGGSGTSATHTGAGSAQTGASDGVATHVGAGSAQTAGSDASATHAGAGSAQAAGSGASATHAGAGPAQAAGSDASAACAAAASQPGRSGGAA
jgi:general secretion pathway protein D